jgi:hypothetical protein
LDTIDALFSCRSRNIIISKGNEIKQVTLYPFDRSINELEQIPLFEETDYEEETIHSFCNIAQSINFKEENDENLLNHFISNPYYIEKFESSQQISTNDLWEQSFRKIVSEFFTIFISNYISCKDNIIFS